MKLQKIFGLLALAAVLFVGTGAGVAHAGPVYVSQTVQTAAATTSPTYMTPGTATTTLTYDSYFPSTDSFNYAANYAGLLLQYAGASNSAVLGIKEEFSEDGIDWYQNYGLGSALAGTTTNPVTIGSPFSYSYKFLGTPNDGAGGTVATTTAFISLYSPMRFLRVITTLTGANAAVWEQIIPVKEKA